MRIRGLAFVGSLLMALLVPAVANAYQSVTTGGVNVRTGAGVNNARIASLPPGASVSVDYCRSGWCLVSMPGLRGWVSARYLELAGTDGAYSYRPQGVYVPPTVNVPPPYVVPRDSYHDYSYNRQYNNNRPFIRDRTISGGK